MLYRRISPILVAAFTLLPVSAGADEVAAPSATKAPEPALPDLPKPPARALRVPGAGELAALDEILTGLRSNDANVRDQSRAALNRIDESLIPAIAERLRRLSETVNKLAMKETLESLQREARDKARAENEAQDSVSLDYLQVLLERPNPDNESWKNLVSVLSMSRMLVNIGTVEATRELIGIYVRFGEFLRIDTQRGLEKLGDRSLAALIEATQHQAPKISDWAKKRLALMGKSNPSEVVQLDTPGVLADVLRAYGSTRDPDTARLIISFTSSEHAEVRRAARQAVTLLGEVANWPLRDTYEKLTGKRPFREWSWDRCARELFRELDRARRANVYLTYQAALSARAKGKLDEMRELFDEVLTLDPSFENSNEMAQGYFEYAKNTNGVTPDNASAALERAERLATEAPLHDEIQSLRLTLEGTRLLARGVADQMLFRRALLLDPENQSAKEHLELIESRASATPSLVNRYRAAGAIAILTLIAAIFLLKPPTRQNPPRAASPTPPKESAEP